MNNKRPLAHAPLFSYCFLGHLSENTITTTNTHKMLRVKGEEVRNQRKNSKDQRI